jgi:DNA-binding response OmpR family regulator
VDDEPDVLDTLEDVLSMCEVVKATSFEEAKRQLEEQRFDMTVLDIMGVDGYKLLDMAVSRKVTAVMLTAHALSPEDTIKSFKGGAAYYVPKDKMAEMPAILANILDALKRGKSTWLPFMNWAEAYYNAKFGSKWESHKKELTDKLK